MSFEFNQGYLDHLKQIKYSSYTIKEYKNIIKRCEKYCSQQGISCEKEITEKVISEYLKYMKSRLKIHTYGSYLAKLRKYFLYLEREGLIFVSPLREVELPKIPRPLTRIFTEQEIEEILDRIDTSKRKGVRLRTILELLYSSALRPCELVNIKHGDINFQKKTLFIRKSKNLKDRLVPVGESALFWIQQYLEKVYAYFHKDCTSPYVFLQIRQYGKRMTTDSLLGYLKKALNRLGVEDFYPSMLRPSAASHLLARGMDIRNIQQLLGHNDIVTTQIYLRVSLNELKKHVSPNLTADKRSHTNEP